MNQNISFIYFLIFFLLSQVDTQELVVMATETRKATQAFSWTRSFWSTSSQKILHSVQSEKIFGIYCKYWLYIRKMIELDVYILAIPFKLKYWPKEGYSPDFSMFQSNAYSLTFNAFLLFLFIRHLLCILKLSSLMTFCMTQILFLSSLIHI